MASEDGNQFRTEKSQLFHDIINQCQFGLRLSNFSNSIRDRLEKYERNVRKEIVGRKDKMNCAPLFYACHKGTVEMVEYLISTCDADVEQSGYWDECGWGRGKMVTPLWCAAASGRTPVIECLMRHGAQANAASGSSGTTPVQIACLAAKLGIDVVECLVKNGADIHLRDESGRTCLMNSVRNVKLCKLLLKNGADVDAIDSRNNKTPLHYAIEGKLFDTVKVLLDYGADVTLRSLDNDDALQTACLVQSHAIFEYLAEHGSYSPGRLADANELIGLCCFDTRQKALNYWRKAIEIRNSNAVDGNPLAKTPSMPKRDCYRNATEFTTLDELNAIALDSDALTIQYLLIHERIFGEHYRTFRKLRGAGVVYARSFRYQYCVGLWRRALEISVVNDSIGWSDVSDVARGLVLAINSLERIPLEVADPNRVNTEQSRFADVVAIFKLLMSRLIVSAQPPPEKHQSLWSSRISDHYNEILKCIIHLMSLLVITARTSEAEAEVRALVRHYLVNQNPISPRNQETLLHLCVSNHTAICSQYFPRSDYVHISPDLEVVKLLLECEADVNARNKDGRTPLLIITSFDVNFCDQIVKLLLDHGAHLDTPDKWGLTPAFDLSAKPHHITVDHLGKYMMLRCLAAQAVVKYGIPCNDLPASVNRFLDLHRPL